MPLTRKGRKIMDAMIDQYGPKEGRKVFYRSRNRGTIKGVEEETQMNWQNKLYESLTENRRVRYGGQVGYSGGGGTNKPPVIMDIETIDGKKYTVRKDKEGNVISIEPVKPLPGKK